MPAAFRRALREYTMFSFRAWRESRSAPRVVAGCRCNSSRRRIRRRPAPQTDACLLGNRLRPPPWQIGTIVPAGSVVQFATTETVNANPPRPPTSARAAQPRHSLADRAVDDVVIHTLEKAIQSREMGHAHQPHCLTQFAMLAQPHFGLCAKGPVLVMHPGRESPATAVG